MYRWILQRPGKPMRRGSTVPTVEMPADGETLHLVDQAGSMTVQAGLLRVDGQIAVPGDYRAEFSDGALVLAVGGDGLITDRGQEVA